MVLRDASLRRARWLGATLILIAACGDNAPGRPDAAVDAPPIVPRWSPALLVNNRAATPIEAPLLLAADGSGRAVVVWSESMTGTLWANRFAAATGWGRPDRIDVDGRAVAPDLALNARGDAVVVWRETTEAGLLDIWAQRMTLIGGPGGAEPLAQGAVTLGNPKVAIDGAGNATAVWTEGDARVDMPLEAARFTPGSGWSAAAPLDLTKGQARLHAVSSDPGGTTMVVWERFEGNRKPIVRARFHNGTDWLQEKTFDGQSGALTEHRGAAIGAGVGLVSWLRADNSSEIWAARVDADRGWGVLESLGMYPSRTVVPASAVVADGNGGALVSWSLVPLADFAEEVLVRRWSLASGLEAVVGLTPPKLDEVSFDVAVNGAGGAAIVWHQRTFTGESPANPGTFRRTLMARRLVAGAWEEPTPIIEDVAARLSSPQIAIETGGNALAVWIECDDAGLCNVRSSYYDATPTVSAR